jgi:hypothetical protein
VAGAVRLTACAGLALLAACGSGPPVQEMSDARQAIAVAREAGAAERASADLEAAERYLENAQRHLSERAYNAARENALKAKLKALDALAAAEQEPDREHER